MEWLIGLLVVLAVWWTIWHWYITLPLGVIAVVIYLIVKANKEEKRRQAAKAQQEAEKAARLQCHKEEQQRYYEQMIVLCDQSLAVFEWMPKLLISAEKHLNHAEIDFADGAFAPFWDSIEAAAKALGHFDECARRINHNLSSYGELIKKYEDTPPVFPLAPRSIAKLEVGKATAERMQGIVRKAQCNFQFATIYEQRKTNQILVAGFVNLAQALNEMTWRITDSIDALRSSVDGMTSTLDESMRAIHSRMGDIAEEARQHYKEILKEGSERRAREEKIIEMLDNIQRGRRPFP